MDTNLSEIDLFESEQKTSERAAVIVRNALEGEEISAEEYVKLADAYDRLLEQLRRATHLSDRTASVLYESTLDLVDKVHHDAMTGIYNRRYMEDGLKRVISTMTRSGGGKLSVLMMDLDFFKKYNDEYGHDMGDGCLKAVAKAFEESILRPGDFVVRYGGEEFVAVLPNTDESGACEVATRILKNVRKLNLKHGKSEISDIVTVSIGITSASVLDTRNGLDLIRRADEALYTSKHSGRNRYTYKSFKKG
jgi:diguanylate cyclase (GGDEF)-like protein